MPCVQLRAKLGTLIVNACMPVAKECIYCISCVYMNESSIFYLHETCKGQLNIMKLMNFSMVHSAIEFATDFWEKVHFT